MPLSLLAYEDNPLRFADTAVDGASPRGCSDQAQRCAHEDLEDIAADVCRAATADATAVLGGDYKSIDGGSPRGSAYTRVPLRQRTPHLGQLSELLK